MRGNLDAITGLFKAHASGKILVVTGADISLASGIPTFRGQDPGAIWKKDVMALGTFCCFSQDPVGSWRWRRSPRRPAPGSAHHPLETSENTASHSVVPCVAVQIDYGLGVLNSVASVARQHARAEPNMSLAPSSRGCGR
jgi:hypothetical protein